MPRSLSSRARRAIFAPQTGEVFVVLLELTHPGLAAPIRVCSNGEAVNHGGNDYLAFPFRATLLSEPEDSVPVAQIEIDNVDRRIVEAIRSVSGEPITATMKVVLASTPEFVEAGPFTLKLRDVSYDALTVAGTLSPDDTFTAAFPAPLMSPTTLPGLF
jgi:hypothetical protein